MTESRGEKDGNNLNNIFIWNQTLPDSHERQMSPITQVGLKADLISKPIIYGLPLTAHLEVDLDRPAVAVVAAAPVQDRPVVRRVLVPADPLLHVVHRSVAGRQDLRGRYSPTADNEM